MVHKSAYIHPLACVTDSAVGKNSAVWQFASVIRGAVIGERCTIASGALVDGSRIGHGSIVSQNVAMGPGFDVGREVFIGPNVTLCNDSWPRAEKGGFIGFVPALAFETAEQAKDHMAIVIGDGASIGANSVILPGLTIGRDAMIAAGSTVWRDVPDQHLWFRDDLRPITDETVRLKNRVKLA